jgi:hypothetical protein
MRRVAAVPTQDATCSTYRLNYRTTQDFERSAKVALQGYLNTIRGYTGSRIEQLKASNVVADTALYNTALQTLQLAENNAQAYIKCINGDVIQRNDYSSRIYSIQQELETLRKEVQAKKEIVTEAKERSTQLENPYNNTTWWETWFPLGRPIQKENVPVLLSVSILMLVFSLGIFLRFAGKELRFESIGTSTNSFLKNMNRRANI